MLKILSASDDDREWDEYFRRLPRTLQDVHFTSAYARIHQSRWEGKSLLAVYDRHGDFVMQPFFLRRIDDTDYSDMTSLYGYGGAIGTDDIHAAAFHDAVWNWARSRLVVSEFCCRHPLYNDLQGRLFNLVTTAYTAAKDVVVINLGNLELEKMRRNVRRGIRAANDAGVTLHDGTPKSFEAFYNLSMRRLNGGDYWIHPLAYWEAHRRETVGAQFWEAWTGEGCHRTLLTISGASGTAYAHFLGSDAEYRHAGLDAFLYYTVARELKEQGCSLLHLGGGTDFEADNPLLQFKSGFSDRRLMAKRYGRIFDAVGYDILCARKERTEKDKRGRTSTAQSFPMYRRRFE